MSDVIRNPKIPARIVKLLNRYKEKLSDWEQNFLQSVFENFAKNGYLSQKQNHYLEKIENKYDPELDDAWKARFEETGKEIWDILVKYYSTTQYYQWIIAKTKEDPNYVPTELEFNKLFKNKYAAKILANARSEHKFVEGALVQLRHPTADALLTKFKLDLRAMGKTTGKYPRSHTGVYLFPFVVVKQLDKYGSAKGSKFYHIAPLGMFKIYEAEERWMKNIPKKFLS